MSLSSLLPEPKYWLLILLGGFIAGEILVWFDTDRAPLVVASVIPIAPRCVPPHGFLALATSAGQEACLTYEEAMRERLKTTVIPPFSPPRPDRSRPTPAPYYRKYVPLAKGQSPNSVRLVKAQAPLPVSAKKINGRYVCAEKSDSPRKSYKNGRAHIDRQCCLDPDEVPNPHCTY